MKKAFILSLLLALSVCSCGDNLSDDPPEVFPEHLTLDDLAEYNKGKTPEYKNDNFGVSIHGNIAGYRIKNTETAAGALKGISELLEVDEEGIELTFDHFFDNPTEDVYGFQINYKGAAVYGNMIELSVDKKSKKALNVISNISEFEKIDLTPVISSEEAVGIAQQTDGFRTNEKPPVLMIYNGDTLVWYIEGVSDGDTSKEMMINAIDGTRENYIQITVTQGESEY